METVSKDIRYAFLTLVRKPDGLRLVAAGVAVGRVLALLITRLMKGLLFGVRAALPATYLAITALLLANCDTSLLRARTANHVR